MVANVSSTSLTLVTTLAGDIGNYSPVFSDGTGTVSATFDAPEGVDISSDGTFALVADKSNHLVRKIVISTAVVTTLAGSAGVAGSTDGVGTTSATFNEPLGVALSPDDSMALVAPWRNHAIRKIVISTAEVTTLAGSLGVLGSTDGIGTTSATFTYPRGVDISLDGLIAIVADYGNTAIRKIVLSTATTTTLTPALGDGMCSNNYDYSCQTDGIGANAAWMRPWNVALSSDGLYVYVSTPANIRQVVISTGEVTSPFGGVITIGLAFCPSGNFAIRCDPVKNHPKSGVLLLISWLNQGILLRF